MATQTDKLKIRLIQPSEDFADDAFNKVIKDIDNKVVGVFHLTSGAHWDVWKANTDYVVGDVVRTPHLKSNQYMECTVAGTTGSNSPTNNIQGSNVTDNTVTWTIKALGGASDSTVSFWKGNTHYYKGSLVIYNNKLYRSYSSHTSSNFDNDKATWFEVQASINAWVSSRYYAVGDTVVYNGNVYQCNTENTDSSFTDAHWDLLNSYGIVKDWTASTKFFKNQLIAYGGAIYKATNTFTSGNSFSNTNLTLVSSSIMPWASDVYYSAGVVVQKDNIMYKCITAHTSSNSFKNDYSNWELFHTPNAFVRNWQANVEYKTGQLVTVNGNIYRRTGDGYDTTWSTGFWELVSVGITDWAANTAYVRGQYVNYKNALYKCITANTDATFTVANWEKISGGNLVDWATSIDYVVGDIVLKNDRIYQCTTAHTSSTFDSDIADWKEISSYVVHIDDWATGTKYKAGDLVAYDAQIYRCKVAHTSASAFSTDDTKWEILSPTINIIKDWAVSTAYTLGQFVTHNNVLYKCNTAHTSDSTSFDTDIAKWDKIGSSIDQWKANTPYRINDLVIYANKLYSCDINHTSANAIDLSKWTLIGDTGIKDWESSKAYKTGQLVLHGNVLYRIHDNHTSSAQITSDDAHLDFVWANIRPWQTNTYYKVGSIVKHNGCLYECLQSHTSGQFNISYVYNGSGKLNYVRTGDVQSDVTVNPYTFDLGSIVTVTGAIFTINQNSAHWGTLTFEISDDNTNFTTLTTWHNASTWQNDTDEEFSASFEGTGRYLRVSAVMGQEGSSPKHTTLTTLKVLSYDTTKWNPLSGYPQWQASVSYHEGDLVTHNGDIYKCLVKNGDATFNTAKWKNVTSGGGINDWATNTQYRVADVVIYQAKIYKCLTAHTSSSFSSDRSNWIEISPTSLQNWQASITYPVDSIVLYNNSTGLSSWVASTSYAIGDKVVKDGYIYSCKVANSESTFSETNWNLVEPVSILIYRCLTENSDASFDPQHWQAVNKNNIATKAHVEALWI